MKIAIISKSDRLGGGASRVAEDLAIWFNELGYPTDHFIAFSNQKPLPFQKNLYGNELSAQLCKTIHSLTNKVGFRELLPAEYWFNLNRLLDDYDIIHFHDLFTAISPLTLALIAQRKPTFFTVHDCSAFTGGCLYPMDCEKFTSYCHHCPQLPQDGWKNQIRDRTKEIQSLKRWITKQFPIQYVFPSQWMALEAQKALNYKIPPQIIPYGIDTSCFTEQTKSTARTHLNLPQNRRVVTLSAHFLYDPRKGVKYAINALQSVVDLAPVVLLVGFIDDEVRKALNGLEVKEMGYISDRRDLIQAYVASDIMLFCTLADNLPLTVMEGMMTSTVVIAFATGGVPEMIQTGRNGFLVETANQEALNQVLRQALLTSDLESIGQQARKDAENKYLPQMCVERHLELYQTRLK